MREGKNPARVLALLTLAKSEDEDTEAGASANACLDLEEIAAMAEPARPEPAKPEPAKPEEQLSWEQRRRLTRHLASCPECYRLWLEVARQTGGAPLRAWPLAWRWPRLSFKAFAYAGGALATAAACLLLFLHSPPPPREMNVALPAPAAKPAPSAAAKEMAAAQNETVAVRKERAKIEPQAEPLATKAAQPADELTDKTAEKRDGSIHVGSVEERRSTDQLTVWYGDLRELCRLSQFVPADWTALYARGAKILEALPEDGENEETDRLWLVLGQMEGLTADRRQNFCAWSEKELVRKLEKKGR